uniref:ATP synthase peripheral stalk subunit F6, mitochondrial n=1 Tax=Scleropages formosus TaxID=113540 RepID=A0A8C9WG01_SCLFO
VPATVRRSVKKKQEDAAAPRDPAAATLRVARPAEERRPVGGALEPRQGTGPRAEALPRQDPRLRQQEQVGRPSVRPPACSAAPVSCACRTPVSPTPPAASPQYCAACPPCRAAGGVVDTGPAYEKNLSEEIGKLQRLYGGGDLTTFPEFKFPEPKLEEVVAK